MSANSLPFPATGRPLITVVTPVYNCAAYIDELIQSVMGQSYSYFEHIVIDDGSTDNGATVDVLRRYPHLRWWSRPNKGQYATLNEGIESAVGDLLVIISADDAFDSPQVFAEVVSYWNQDPTLDAIYGRTALIDTQSRILPNRYGRPDERYPLWINRHFLLIHHCSLFVSLPFVRKHAPNFDTTLRFTGDWDWINRIVAKGRLRFVDCVWSKYRIHAEQTRQATSRSALIAEDKLVLSRHGSSYLKHQFFVTYFRAKKFILLVLLDGASTACIRVKQFLRRR